MEEHVCPLMDEVVNDEQKTLINRLNCDRILQGIGYDCRDSHGTVIDGYYGTILYDQEKRFT